MPMLMARPGDVEAVVLPVTSKRLLVGRCPGGEPRDLADFNAAAAANSDDFFIAASPVQDDSLRAIGTASSTAIRTLVDGLFADIERRPRKPPAIPDVTAMVDAPAATGAPSFGVIYTGFTDEALTAETTEVVKIIVGPFPDVPAGGPGWHYLRCELQGGARGA